MSLGAKSVVTWDQVAAFVKPPDPDIPVVEQIVDGVSEFFNSYTRRTLAWAAYAALYLDGNGSGVFWLPNAPVTALTSLALGSPTPVALTPITDYLVDTERGKLYKVSGEWTLGTKNLLITYNAGWTPEQTMPADLRLACLKQADHEYRLWLSKGYGETSRSQGGESVGVSTDHLVSGVQDVLDRYARIAS